ncbi:hypothetical protein CHLNCDRAFT_142745 [Chlorella variabilis]|uniref:TAP42-like protein n=1 Tax=Chlorella variabilis TaxID=554065 RepID=E1Z8M8_CHLVA|nr:hypothetical protein CHLNCDRAFT_142745 [Chlorella variabilis]EFN57365.1 hypothetical protein CHLNCDRAFT_142745 [Chlorella variabilis]|eukprot:XP_005849467.1 hypothetical protein CHLNCDRAFT_142745 [Chlorella variabilis]
MSDSEDLQDVPLPALFQRGRALLKQLEGLPASDAGTQQLVQRGGAVWRQAAAAADALALFSSNEELEDLATADIKYLLIPFYAAEALTHTHAADPRARIAALTSAAEQYRAFLHRCRQYGLLSPPATAMADAALQQGDGGGDHGSKQQGRTLDAATLRQNKIEKFKREKYVKGRLAELEQRQRQQAGAGEGEHAGGQRGGDAEEADRELWMLQADLAALQAAERMGTLQQEVQILAHAAAMPEQQRQREREQRQQAGPPPDLLRQLHAAAGGLAGAGARREQLAAGVFRPGHVQPTMSVEQFGELEMVEQQRREAAAKERHERQQAARRAEDVEEEQVQQQRAWDDFKDDNPRGWGNSKLRPCS